MENKEYLKSMLTNIVHERDEEAAVDFHNYLKTKINENISSNLCEAKKPENKWYLNNRKFSGQRDTLEFEDSKSGERFIIQTKRQGLKLVYEVFVFGNYGSNRATFSADTYEDFKRNYDKKFGKVSAPSEKLYTKLMLSK